MTTIATMTASSSSTTTVSKNDDKSSSSIHLPTEVLIGHVVPFLDRQSQSRFAATNKEVLLAYKRSLPTSQLPWPTRLDISKNHHLFKISCVGISPDGTNIAAGGSNGCIIFWNVQTGESRKPLEGGHWPGEAVVAIAFSKDGKWMASASTDHTIILWNIGLNGGDDTKIFKKIHAGHVTCLDFFFGGGGGGDNQQLLLLASGHSQRESIKLWNLSHGACVTEFRGNHNSRRKVETMKVSDDGKHIRVTIDDGSIKLWNLQDSTYDFWVGGQQNAVGQSPTTGGLVIASTSTMNNNDHDGDHSNVLMLWNRERREHFQLTSSSSVEQQPQQNHDHHPTDFVFSPNAKKLAVVDNSNFVKIWNSETGQLERSIHDEHAHSFDSLSFSSSDDSKWLVAISLQQNQIRVMRT